MRVVKQRDGGIVRRVMLLDEAGAELAELFSVARSTVYRAVQRAGEPAPVQARRA